MGNYLIYGLIFTMRERLTIMNKYIKVNREQIIKELSFSMFDAMESDAEYRLWICQNGHRGFNNLSDDELLNEYKDYIELDDNEFLTMECAI
jgi:hypothetical protein